MFSVSEVHQDQWLTSQKDGKYIIFEKYKLIQFWTPTDSFSYVPFYGSDHRVDMDLL